MAASCAATLSQGRVTAPASCAVYESRRWVRASPQWTLHAPRACPAQPQGGVSLQKSQLEAISAQQPHSLHRDATRDASSATPARQVSKLRLRTVHDTPTSSSSPVSHFVRTQVSIRV